LLSGKSVLVTGASGGVGRELAYALSRAGASIFLSGRDPDRLAITCAELEKNSGLLRGSFACDLSKNTDTLLDELCGRDIEIDILVNCAGVFSNKSLEGISLDEFDYLFSVNVRAPFELIKSLTPSMARKKWGRIVNIGSTSSIAGFRNSAAYCASKHALLGLTRAVNAEFGNCGIQALCVCPGTIDTDMGQQVADVDPDTMIGTRGLSEFIASLLQVEGGFSVPEVVLPRSSVI
jgi:gluconate 5-dehydrogenase